MQRTIDLKYLNVLRQIQARLSGTEVNWVLTGSLGMVLQGVPIEEVHDIDIQCDKSGAYEIERLFHEFVIRRVAFSSAERVRSHFGTLMIDGIKVEIMGDMQKRCGDGTWGAPPDLERYRQVIEVEGMRIPVLSLEYEYQAYLKLGRMKKAELLRKWLETQRP